LRPLDGRRFWFVGIGGAGMSALALVAHEWGAEVGGSDRARSSYVERLEAAGIPAFGPSAAAAELEGSKAFAKDVMKAAGVTTASYVLLRSREEAVEHLARASYPAVLKADGLAAGKGVLICASEAEARAAVDVFFTERRFGETVVVLEEFLEGRELSLLALCDGENVEALAPAQDYKRIHDGDEGPNTGGMGSYSPPLDCEPWLVEEIVETVHLPVVREMARRGHPFRGVLYAGLMLDEDYKSTVLEFNVRFGDPETQAVLPRLHTDLLELCLRTREPGGLAGIETYWSGDWAVTVVLASAGYPESSSKGDVIHGLAEAAELAEVTHAGTAERDGEIVTAGGRVLNVTGLGPSVAVAHDRAYDAVRRISFDGMQIRTDIAAGAVARMARRSTPPPPPEMSNGYRME